MGGEIPAMQQCGSVCYDGSESENQSMNMVGTFPSSRQMIF